MALSRAALVVALMICLVTVARVEAQKKSPETNSPLCTRDNAIDTTKQQILLTRTFDNAVPRIAVLLRAADLLWPHEQDKALAAFMEAFELALQDYKEVGDEIRRVSQSQFAARYSLPDQRFKVISALAKRDPARARKMSEQMLQDEAKEAANKPATDDQLNKKTAEKLLTLATTLAETDTASAAMFARNSLRYPATLQLPLFLYALAKTNKPAADQFYVEALATYGAAPMDQFLFLSSYPFGNTREAGEMPSYTNYRVPEGFVPNAALQRQFMQAFLARVESAMAEALVESGPLPRNRYPEHAQMWFALSRLEKQVQANLPDLFDLAIRSKEKLFALLNPQMQGHVSRVIDTGNAPKKSFDEQVEAAEKLTDVGRRDQSLTFAVNGAPKDQPLERVLSVIDKISDANIRGPLTNWFYYFRAQALIADKNLIEARKLATRVVELDQRAYLFTRIAEESVKEAADQTTAREMLNEIADAISKGPKTITSARALLTLAHLYAKLDVNRGIEELGNAVRTINTLENPDFTMQFMIVKIEGKTFGSYTSYSTPGFNPENAFREMGKIDFDASLAQAATFSEKSLRSLTTLSVIEPCLGAKSRKKNKVN
jgi:hypothetical protein